MKSVISNAVRDFEAGRMSRRQLVEGLSGLLAAAAAAAAGGAARAQGAAEAAPFTPTGIDHVSVLVEDLERSAEFYRALFGLEALSADEENRILRLGRDGKVLVSIRQRPPEGAIDHYAFKVDGFDMEDATQKLEARGLRADYHVEYGFFTVDPDGAIVQLV